MALTREVSAGRSAPQLLVSIVDAVFFFARGVAADPDGRTK